VDPEAIFVLDGGRELAFSYQDMLRYHGGRSPAGVAHALKVLERALPLLAPDGRIERRGLVIETPFAGPGARDAFELVTRAATEHRYKLDRSLARPSLGPARERFVFRLSYRDRAVTLALRDGFVTDEFIELADRGHRSSAEEHRFTLLKTATAKRLLSVRAEDVDLLAV